MISTIKRILPNGENGHSSALAQPKRQRRLPHRVPSQSWKWLSLAWRLPRSQWNTVLQTWCR